MKSLPGLYVLASVMLMTVPANAQSETVLVSNLDQLWTEGGLGDFHGVSGDPTSAAVAAELFHAGPGQFLVTGLRVEFFFSIPKFDFVLAELAPGHEPGPTTPVKGTFRFHEVSKGETHYPNRTYYADFSSTAPLELAGDRTYWIYAAAPKGTPGSDLMFVNSLEETGAPGWNIQDFGFFGAADEDSPDHWSWYPTRQHLKFELRGVALIPEANTTLLAAAGFLALAMLRGAKA